jgi:sulfite reductase (NADPH) hemoprotein beta-component
MSSPAQPLLSVAQVALLASDVLVDSRPQLPALSQFHQVYKANHNSSNNVISLPPGADTGPMLLRYKHVGLVSYTTTSNAQIFNQLLIHLPELSELPLVLHICLSGDNDNLSDVLVLKSSVPFFIYSRTAQQAHDNALLASRLARVERKAVVHVFHHDNAGNGGSVDTIDEVAVRQFLLAEKVSGSPTSGYTNGNGSRHMNGETNGHVNEHANGQTNGHMSGHAKGDKGNMNGHTNGHSMNGGTKPDISSQLFAAYLAAALATTTLTGRPLSHSARHGSNTPHTLIFTLGHAVLDFEVEGVLFIDVSLLSPFPHAQILEFVNPGVLRIIVLEQVRNWSMKWTPLYLDIVSVVKQVKVSRPTIHSGVIGDTSALGTTDILTLVANAKSSSSTLKLELGPPTASHPSKQTSPYVPKHEASYTTILNQLFGDRLEISNSPIHVSTQGQSATSPEFALGRVQGQVELKERLIRIIQKLLQDSELPEDLHSLLSQWIVVKDDPIRSRSKGEDIIKTFGTSTFSHPATQQILDLRSYFAVPSRWIIGSDAWSYDLGSSGLHHAIASGLNINILIIDSVPYSSRNNIDSERRKQDVGLYAMNHGDVYVASVAVYSSYSQVLHALIEADKFVGPSVILAYLPYDSEDTSALEILKETKLAVDAGYWPLYRWNPSKEDEGKEPFSLDSEAVKNDLRQFLDRQNHLSQLTRSTPQFASELVSSLGETVKEARKKRAQQAYDELLSAIDAPTLLVVYASDGGQAEKVAKRLANRGKLRGLSTSLSVLNSVSLAELSKEEYVVFVTSVAGQGEFPQNGRAGWKLLNSAAASGEKNLSHVKFTVFGMGDSHYWPRPEDSHYYNKAGKDLNKCLELLGAERVVDLGLGDDQDADGYETGYRIWEPKLWKVLGIENIEVKETEPDPITNEHIKAASSYLRGTIAEGLLDNTTGALAASDTQLTKFHGIYQQDDRDIRDEREAQGVEPAYAFMIRLRIPGGVCDSRQWLLIDQIADKHGCGTFKVTTRQTFQLHGVIKRHLKPAIQDINRALLDTLAACGDVNR